MTETHDAFVELRLPCLRGPEAQATGPLLGQDAVGRFGHEQIVKRLRDQHPVPLVDLATVLAEQKPCGIGHRVLFPTL